MGVKAKIDNGCKMRMQVSYRTSALIAITIRDKNVLTHSINSFNLYEHFLNNSRIYKMYRKSILSSYWEEPSREASTSKEDSIAKNN